MAHIFINPKFHQSWNEFFEKLKNEPDFRTKIGINPDNYTFSTQTVSETLSHLYKQGIVQQLFKKTLDEAIASVVNGEEWILHVRHQMPLGPANHYVSNYGRTVFTYLTEHSLEYRDIQICSFDFWIPPKYIDLLVIFLGGLLSDDTNSCQRSRMVFQRFCIANCFPVGLPLKIVFKPQMFENIIRWIESQMIFENLEQEKKEFDLEKKKFEEEKKKFEERKKQFEEISNEYFDLFEEKKKVEERKRKLILVTNKLFSEKEEFENEKRKFYNNMKKIEEIDIESI